MPRLESVEFILFLALSAGIGFTLAFFGLRLYKKNGYFLVYVMMFLSAWDCIATAMLLLPGYIVDTLLKERIEFVPRVLLIPVLFVFTIRFVWPSRRFRLGGHLLLLAVTLLGFGFFWLATANSSYSLDYSPGFWALTGYQGILGLASFVLLVIHAVQARGRARLKGLLILLGGLLISYGLALWFVKPGLLDSRFAPVYGLLGTLLIGWGVYSPNLSARSLLALDAALKRMTDGVILLDEDGKVVNLNSAAEQIVGMKNEEALRLPFQQIFPQIARDEISQILSQGIEGRMELGPEGRHRTYAISVSHFGEDDQHPTSLLIILRDVTDLLRAQNELERRETDLRQAQSFFQKVINTVPMGISIFNLEDRQIEFSNHPRMSSGRSVEEYNRLTEEEMVRLIHPDEVESRHALLSRLPNMQDGEICSLEFRHKNGDDWGWMRMYYTVFERNDQGQANKILAVSEDITDYHRALDELSASEKRYRSLFEGISIGLYRSTPDGSLLDVNLAMVKMLHYPDRESLLARNANDLYYNPLDRIIQQEHLQRNHSIDHYEMQLVCWDGEVIWVSDSPHLTVDPQGSTINEGSIEDITLRKQVESDLHASEEKFRNIYDLSPNSIMLVDLSAKILDCNQGTLRLHGYNDKSAVISRKVTDLVSIEDHHRLVELLESTLDEGGAQGLELNMIHSNGKEFAVEISTSVIPNPLGRPKMMIISASDISSRIEARAELQDAQAQLAQRVHELESRTRQITLLTEMSNMLQVCIRPSEAYGFIGRYAENLFPQASGVLMILDPNLRQLNLKASWGTPPLEQPVYLPEDCWALRSGQAFLAGDGRTTRLCKHFRNQVPFSSLCVPIFSEGEIIGAINLIAFGGENPLVEGQVQLASAMAEQVGLALSNLQLRDNLREQAIHDPLTGLYNRYHLREALEGNLVSARKTNQPVAVIMMDLDHFKAMNTRYGHLNVDALLGEFGKLVQAFTTNGEVALRYGGDEFVLILPHSTLDEAAARANQLRHLVRQLVIPVGEQNIQNLTLSIGIAGWPQHGQTFSELLKAADAALFRAKEYRDAVVIAE